MSNLKLPSKILRLTGMKITDFVFKNRYKELHLTVKPHKNGCRCPECGRRCIIGDEGDTLLEHRFACLIPSGLSVEVGWSGLMDTAIAQGILFLIPEPTGARRRPPSRRKRRELIRSVVT